MAEQSQEHGKSMQEKDLEISALRARAVHFENESTQTKVRLAQLEKQLVAAQHDGTTWQKEAARFSSDLKKSVEVAYSHPHIKKSWSITEHSSNLTYRNV